MKLKEKLLKLIADKEARKKELGKAIDKSEDAAEVRKMMVEITAINDEVDELRAAVTEIEAQEALEAKGKDPEKKGKDLEGDEPESRGAPQVPQGAFKPLGTYRMGNQGATQGTEETEDKYATLEYRKAFMKFAITGEVTPELRDNAMTTTSDVSAVIPSTILREIISKVTIYGQIYARVRKLAIKGGVSVPILSVKPTATWIGESTPSEKKKVQANTNVTFSYYGLECKVSTSLLADTVTLEGFESTITDVIVEAMVQSIDKGIISGDGDGKFLGITADSRVPASRIVTLKPDEFDAWDAWKKKVFAKMPLAYKAGATFIMASGTFEGYIDGMVDANGQPVGRINYGITNGPQERFGGKEVILVEDDVVANYDDASTGDVVGIYCNLKNYAVNSNMQMTMYRYLDHDTNEWVDKAILIADGKLLDPYGVVIIKKGA